MHGSRVFAALALLVLLVCACSPTVASATAVSSTDEASTDSAPPPAAAAATATADAEGYWSIAVLSDMHLGDEGRYYDAWTWARSVVADINAEAARAGSAPVQFVVVTGDIANTALAWQYEEAQATLDQLAVPYLPVLGNHDCWAYNYSASNTSHTGPWETAAPHGDLRFNATFYERLRAAGCAEINQQLVWDPVHQVESLYVNWLKLANGVAFVGLDWNTRAKALPPDLGVMPSADLHRLQGGTWPWLQQTLAGLPAAGVETVILLQHQPFSTPFFFPPWFSFSKEDRAAVQDLLATTLPSDMYWGCIAGHTHMWANGTAFDGWPTFREWTTEACKIRGAWTLVTFQGSKVVQLEQRYAPWIGA